jgi:hypothetical protein
MLTIEKVSGKSGVLERLDDVLEVLQIVWDEVDSIRKLGIPVRTFHITEAIHEIAERANHIEAFGVED